MRIVLSIFCVCLCFTVKAQPILIDSIITKESMVRTVNTLAHDSMQGRLTGTAEAINAAEFIAAEFEKAGLKYITGKNSYFLQYSVFFDFDLKRVWYKGINVLGAIKGTVYPDSSIVFCAHYDHIGTKNIGRKSKKDSIYNGANDNASGVALLIELAKYYTATKMNRYTLVFIAFSGEEQGLLGSADAATLFEQSYIKAVLNFDMVGRPINSWTKKCMVVAEKPNPIIKELNAELNSGEDFFIQDMFPLEYMFKRSDHYSFTEVKKRVFFTATAPTDRFYHTLGDEVGTIDFDFLLTVTKNIAHCCKVFLQ